MATLLKYMLVSMFMVFPAFSADARTRDDAGNDSDISGTVPAPIDRNRPAVFETASFGLGWFWGIESRFGIIEGVISTRVGYAGGSTNAPTYRRMGDHTETVQVDFDAEKITYRQLLDIFWESHTYTRQTKIIQYKNAVFYHNEKQRQQAVASKKAIEQRTGRTVQTDIIPVQSFTLAEDYHQKYLLKHSALNHFLNTFYKHRIDVVNSTAAARLNGYAGGNGTREQLLREIHLLGLDDTEKKVLEKLVGG